MKHYADYTEEELDELYSKLSETAQDFVYSDIIKEEVSNIGKKSGLHLDHWEELENLMIETILGIVPSSLFRTEILNRITQDQKVADQIVAHMESEIFSIIRNEEIDDYSSVEKNISVKNAIYDDALDSLDPYRESVPGEKGQSPAITDEKLHIVDDLFSKSPRSKKYIYEKNIKASSVSKSANPAIITKDVLAKLDGLDISPEAKEIIESGDTDVKNKLILHIEKSTTPGKVRITISKKAHSKPVASNYTIDPYKETAK